LKFAYYPGCSVESSARMYERSLQAVLKMLDVELHEIPDWNCCGATSAHTIPENQATALAARNLGLAEQMGMDVVTGCAACFFRLKTASEEIKADPEKVKLINRNIPVPYLGKSNVYSMLEVLIKVVSKSEKLPEIKRRFKHLKPVCYYGCLFMRAPGELDYDTKENPQSMDKLLKYIGIESLDWSYKVDCCGASAILTQPDTASELIAKIIKDANDRGANAVVTACPMCQLNLELGQRKARKIAHTEYEFPVFFITQILGLAWGFNEKEMEVNRLASGVKDLSRILA